MKDVEMLFEIYWLFYLFCRCSEVPGTGKHERIMFLLREKTKYYVSLTNNVCGLKNQMSSSIPFVEALVRKFRKMISQVINITLLLYSFILGTYW